MHKDLNEEIIKEYIKVFNSYYISNKRFNSFIVQMKNYKNNL